MEQVTDGSLVPVCIHGTTMNAWEKIRESGLNKMGRTAIQMAVGLPGDPGVKSGIRGSVEVLIYVDVRRAMAAGIPFFRSMNNVICSPGPIPPECFGHVCRRSHGQSLLSNPFGQNQQRAC